MEQNAENSSDMQIDEMQIAEEHSADVCSAENDNSRYSQQEANHDALNTIYSGTFFCPCIRQKIALKANCTESLENLAEFDDNWELCDSMTGHETSAEKMVF